jgi:hypothetical protein
MLLPSVHGKPASYFLDGNRARHYAPAVPEAPIVIEPATKTVRRRTLLVACTGLILGLGLFTFLGPAVVSWSYRPLRESLSCSPTVDEALSNFVRLQLGSGLVGVVLALTGLFFWRRFFRLRAEAKQNRAAS